MEYRKNLDEKNDKKGKREKRRRRRIINDMGTGIFVVVVVDLRWW
jgi:hypothetical protein